MIIFEIMTHERAFAIDISVATLGLRVPNAQQIYMKGILNIETAEATFLLGFIFNK
jgi:hypothetical protein